MPFSAGEFLLPQGRVQEGLVYSNLVTANNSLLRNGSLPFQSHTPNMSLPLEGRRPPCPQHRAGAPQELLETVAFSLFSATTELQSQGEEPWETEEHASC